jgi:hypothetical protein
MGGDRRGFALVFVLVLISALLLVAAAFSDVAWQSVRAGRMGWQGERAIHEADAGIVEAVASWTPEQAAALRLAETDTVLHRGSSTQSSLVVRTRLSARSYLLESAVQVRDGGFRPARRRVLRAVALDWPAVPQWAALTTTGAVHLGGSAAVIGTDAVPAGWADECANDRPAAPAPGLATMAISRDSGAIVAGAGPAVQVLTAAEQTALTLELDAVQNAIRRRATQITHDSILDLDRLSGASGCPALLGDARRLGTGPDPCSRRWPVVFAAHAGVTHLTGTAPGQGLLLVDGDLVVHDGSRFAGLLIVRGRLLATAGAATAGSEIVGGVLVRDMNDHGSRLDAPILVQASRCAIRLALAALGTPTPVGQHGWAERR